MATTPNLGITLLEENQSQKHVTINEAITALDLLDPRIDALEAADTGFDTRLDNLEATDVTYDTRLDTLEAADLALDTRLDTIELQDVNTVASAFPFSVLSTHRYVRVAGSGARTLNLPAVAGVPAGTEITFKDATASGQRMGMITITASGAETIDGKVSLVMPEWITIRYDGSEWKVIDRGWGGRVIGTFGDSVGSYAGMVSSTVLAAVNEAYFYSIRPERDVLVSKLAWFTAAATSGNYDIGIYDSTGTRLYSLGSTAWPAINSEVVVTLGAPVLLKRGELYYIAFGGDNTTGTFRGIAAGTGTVIRDLAGVIQTYRMTTSFPLPASVTLTGVSGNRICNITLREA